MNVRRTPVILVGVANITGVFCVHPKIFNIFCKKTDFFLRKKSLL